MAARGFACDATLGGLVIVKLTGGLGNTLFQFAFGRGVAAKTGRQLGFCWQRATRDYALDRYVDTLLIHPDVVSGPVYNERAMTFDPEVYHPAAASHYFCGYWQTPRYFEDIADEIRKEVVPRFLYDREWLICAEALAAKNSAFIHVRRGDYLKPANIAAHGLTPLEYYKAAMQTMSLLHPGVEFYAFSDDQEWCRNNLPGVTVLRTPNADIDFILMHHCRHGILANSTFGWWAAFLGADSAGGTVIAPKKWFGPANQHLGTRDLLPARWLAL